MPLATGLLNFVLPTLIHISGPPTKLETVTTRSMSLKSFMPRMMGMEEVSRPE